MQNVHRCIDILHALELVRDVVVDRQISRHVLVHQTRHLGPTLEPSESGTLPLASGDQLKRSRGDLVTCWGDADDARLAPTAVSAF